MQNKVPLINIVLLQVVVLYDEWNGKHLSKTKL